MMSFFPILIMGGVVALVVFGMLHSRKKAQARREALAAYAQSLGMSYDPSRDSSHDERYAHFGIFRRGHSRAAYNTLTGRMAGPTNAPNTATPVVMGDFTYKVTSNSGKNRSTTTYHFSYAILHLPMAGVPDMLIRPESVFDKIGSAFGFDDIDFESAEFSKKFLVKSADRRFAYDVITPAMMEFLLSKAQHRGGLPAIDIEHGMLCLADGRRRWSAEQFDAQLTFAKKFLDLWPEHVIRDLRSRAG